MTKQKALRLRRGQRITFGDSKWTRDVHHWRSGTVVRVTPRGGILIDTGSGEEWVPYHHSGIRGTKGKDTMRLRVPWDPNPETILKDVLAALDDHWRPGDPMLTRVRQALDEGRARAKRERRRAARELCYARQRARGIKYRPKGGWSIADRTIRVMEPGKWYGVGDVARALDEPRSSRAKMRQVLLARGLVTRTKNPPKREQLDPWQIMSGQEQEPDWLYRLSGSGEAHRAKLLSGSVAPRAFSDKP